MNKIKTFVVVLGLIVLISQPKLLVAADVIPVENLTIPELITKYAAEYKVSPVRMTKTMQCESTFNPNAVGDHGQSFGLSQIHLPSWRGKVTKEQALNPEFAIKFMAEQFSKGNARAWTCWRIYYA